MKRTQPKNGVCKKDIPALLSKFYAAKYTEVLRLIERFRATKHAGENGNQLPKNGVHKEDIPALVSKFVQLTNKRRGLEEESRVLRTALVAAGHLDLARQFLEAPSDLKDLADLLWHGRPIVIDVESTKLKSAPESRRFRKKFRVERIEGEKRPLTGSRLDAEASYAANYTDVLMAMAVRRAKSRLIERFRATMRKGENIFLQPEMIRELAIETAWRFPLEEWAMIFPDAALAGDYDFIKRIVDRCINRPTILDRIDSWIARSWHGFEWLGLTSIPPLKHWSDDAACEFVKFMSGDTTGDFSVPGYQKRKSRLGLKSEKPTLVIFAKYKRSDDGKRHCLHVNDQTV